jgi:Cholesterol oxidase, substrate-binding/FAD binding domain
MSEVQKIECKNMAAFVMSFKVKSASHESGSTSNYPVLQSESIDLSGAGFNIGDIVWPEVHAVWGKTIAADEHFTFAQNGKKAVYEIRGTIWSYTVDFKGIVDDAGATLPNFPSNIPVAQLPFVNWSLAIEADSVWTATPASAADIVTVCNWAKNNGYSVRATGVKHTWSPVTIPNDLPSTAKVLLVNTGKLNNLSMEHTAAGQPAMVRAGTGATMIELLTFLENQHGNGTAPGYSFANTPAPDSLTIGGVLAINGHGTSIPTPPNDAFPIGYGSMSNNIMELTAVVTDGISDDYQLKTFKRGDSDTKALLTHLGRTMIVEVVLHVIDNYNLRCQSFTDISGDVLFAEQTGSTPPPRSLGEYLQNSGRVEAIWFPFSENPWLKVWTAEAVQPAGSRKVDGPNNYPFSDNLPEAATGLIKLITQGAPWFTPTFGKLMYTITDFGLSSDDARDLWGPSKNTLFYVKDTTLRVTANGYAVLMKKANVQNAVAAFARQFDKMLNDYAAANKYPINSPLEIRVTGLDSPDSVPAGISASPGRPVISSLSTDAETIANGWDVALWLDVLTLPNTRYADEFYAELEEWFVANFNGTNARVVPEWSKGWAYTKDKGAWTNDTFMQQSIRKTFTDNRDAGDNWDYEVQTLSNFDKHKLFHTDLLDTLFVNV